MRETHLINQFHCQTKTKKIKIMSIFVNYFIIVNFMYQPILLIKIYIQQINFSLKSQLKQLHM